jgi:F-type H+-transporting ATPase subunit a
MHISMKAETLFNIGPFPFTNSLLNALISLAILVLMAMIVGNNYKRLPSGLQHVFEMVYDMFDGLAIDAMGKEGRKFTPLLCAFFFFIIINNWLGILPLVGSLGVWHDEAKGAAVGPILSTIMGGDGKVASMAMAGGGLTLVPLFRGANADLNMTFALAIIAQVVVHVMGVRSAGLAHHLHHFKNPLEIVSEISKVLSFGFRLFGNVFAGEVLLTAMASIVAVITNNFASQFGISTTSILHGLVGGVLMLPFFLLEIFVGFIQAYVFPMLVLSFLSLFYVTQEQKKHAHAH